MWEFSTYTYFARSRETFIYRWDERRRRRRRRRCAPSSKSPWCAKAIFRDRTNLVYLKNSYLSKNARESEVRFSRFSFYVSRGLPFFFVFFFFEPRVVLFWYLFKELSRFWNTSLALPLSRVAEFFPFTIFFSNHAWYLTLLQFYSWNCIRSSFVA